MKKLFFSWLLSIFVLSTINAQFGSERTGYEGDYFSLEGAIELFKQSRSIKAFERKINSKDSWVNNLDLNYDGRIDYIRVEHRQQGDFHAIILQVPVDNYELQDVAVIEIERIGRREVILQIIGDRDLYGEEVIVEPFETLGNASHTRSSYSNSGNSVNVYYWPLVQNILDHRYAVYVSPYRWNYYPTWWTPWRQYSWNVYHPRIRNYYRHCHVVNIHRVYRVHNFYRPYRSHSHHVARRAQKVRVNRAGSSVYHSSARGEARGVYGSANRKIKQQPRNATPSQRLATKKQVHARTATKSRSAPQPGNATRGAVVQRPRTVDSGHRIPKSTDQVYRSKKKEQIRQRPPSSVQRSSQRESRPARSQSSLQRQQATVNKAGTHSGTSPRHRVNTRQAVRPNTSSGNRRATQSVDKPSRKGASVQRQQASVKTQRARPRVQTSNRSLSIQKQRASVSHKKRASSFTKRKSPIRKKN